MKISYMEPFFTFSLMGVFIIWIHSSLPVDCLPQKKPVLVPPAPFQKKPVLAPPALSKKRPGLVPPGLPQKRPALVPPGLPQKRPALVPPALPEKRPVLVPPALPEKRPVLVPPSPTPKIPHPRGMEPFHYPPPDSRYLPAGPPFHGFPRSDNGPHQIMRKPPQEKNSGKIIGFVFLVIVGVLQVALVGFLVFKRRQISGMKGGDGVISA